MFYGSSGLCHASFPSSFWRAGPSEMQVAVGRLGYPGVSGSQNRQGHATSARSLIRCFSVKAFFSSGPWG